MRKNNERNIFCLNIIYIMSCDGFVFFLLIIVIAIYVNRFANGREGFNVDSQNFIYNNKFDNAEMLQYDGSNNQPVGMYQKPNVPIYGASVDFGVNQNSQSDVFDERGYNATRSTESFSEIDLVTNALNNAQLRNDFSRMYMLDSSSGPDNVAQFDVANMDVDKRCCSAQYAPPFEVGNGDNASFANKYVANNYSGMNYYSNGTGCPCFTKRAAEFYGARGGNAV